MTGSPHSAPGGDEAVSELMRYVNATKDHAAAVLANTKAVEANTAAHVKTQEMLARLISTQPGSWLDVFVRHFNELKQRMVELSGAIDRRR